MTVHTDWCHIDNDCCGCTCTDAYTEYAKTKTEEPHMANPFTIYVCGPMTGLPELNFPEFFEADGKLRAAGYAVLNPADRAGRTADQTWEWYLRRGIRDVTEADGLAMLPGWDESQGARLELETAKALAIPYTTVDGWIAVAPKLT